MSSLFWRKKSNSKPEIKNNIEDNKISDLFFETFSVLATDTKLINILKNESVKVEREILLQNGELKPIETIKHYMETHKLITDDELKAIEKNVKEIVTDCAEFAQTSPEPDASELYTDVLID